MKYQVDITDQADAEAEEAHLWILERSPEGTSRWWNGLEAAILSLEEMPTRCPLAPENEEFEEEIRELLQPSPTSPAESPVPLRPAADTQVCSYPASRLRAHWSLAPPTAKAVRVEHRGRRKSWARNRAAGAPLPREAGRTGIAGSAGMSFPSHGSAQAMGGRPTAAPPSPADRSQRRTART
jgi:hypothetical protein